uniref:Auto-transporter adhesin head GIN domain-containing protein n=1 Tax=Prevotella sp. GTC17259 TaxID=3236795 RepID=A0AB33J429_9BACT
MKKSTIIAFAYIVVAFLMFSLSPAIVHMLTYRQPVFVNITKMTEEKVMPVMQIESQVDALIKDSLGLNIQVEVSVTDNPALCRVSYPTDIVEIVCKDGKFSYRFSPSFLHKVKEGMKLVASDKETKEPPLADADSVVVLTENNVDRDRLIVIKVVTTEALHQVRLRNQEHLVLSRAVLPKLLCHVRADMDVEKDSKIGHLVLEGHSSLEVNACVVDTLELECRRRGEYAESLYQLSCNDGGHIRNLIVNGSGDVNIGEDTCIDHITVNPAAHEIINLTRVNYVEKSIVLK